MKKILVVDDEKSIVKGIKFSLEQDDMKVEVAYDGETALELAKANHYDMILLDIMLPGFSGLEVCQMIREFSDVPIIMLTAKGDDMDKILGLEYGADDYITKPFSTRELIARIKRVANKNSKKNIITVSGVTLDLDKSAVFENGKQLELTALEYKLLSLLMQNAGKVVTRELIFEKIWDVSGNFVNDNTLTVYIKRIRKKLDADIIKTVKGMGYQVAEVSE